MLLLLFSFVYIKLLGNYFLFILFLFNRVGRPDANVPQDIKLSGSHILNEHCIFENFEGITFTYDTD